MRLEDLFSDDPYSLSTENKQKVLSEILNDLTQHHQERCTPYRKILNALPELPGRTDDLENVPMLPVRLFKMHELRSVPSEEVVKTLTSSGTTSQAVSRIYLDKETSVLQTKVLAAIIKSFLGNKRLPMILVDNPNIIKDRTSFSARGAGLLGLTFFGRDHFYLLDENMEVRWLELEQFLERHQGETILLFGFTFMVWQYFYQASLKKGKPLNMGESILIHSGGWKKLKESSVDNATFKELMRKQLGIQHIYNFYGMVEQVGSIFMECEHGNLHAPDFADIIIRDPVSLRPLENGHPGLVQVLSVLPRSYPGHSLLTEDLGTVLGSDNCPCGRMGKYFSIHGRLPAAELRGCSDTHAYDQGGI